MTDSKIISGSYSGVTHSQEDSKQSLDSILGKHTKGPSREVGLRRLAKKLQDIDLDSTLSKAQEVGATL